MLKKFAVVYSRTCFFNIFKFLKSETPVKVWENQKKLWKHSTTASCSHSISRSPKLSLVFLQLDRNRVHVFYFLKFRTQSPFLCPVFACHMILTLYSHWLSRWNHPIWVLLLLVQPCIKLQVRIWLLGKPARLCELIQRYRLCLCDVAFI